MRWFGGHRTPGDTTAFEITGASRSSTITLNEAFVVLASARVAVTFTGVVPIEWSEATEVGELQRLSIGIMPVLDKPFQRGKCGYKLIQYMACGLPVVASPVGVNSEIVRPGLNGALADTPEEWLAALAQLADDPALRTRLGGEGRKRVEDRYSLQAQAPRLISILQEAVRRGRA